VEFSLGVEQQVLLRHSANYRTVDSPVDLKAC